MEHKIGNWTVEDGSIVEKGSFYMLQEPSVLLLNFPSDKEMPSMLVRIGNKEKLKKLMEKKRDRHMFDDDYYELISFNIKYPEFGYCPDGYLFTADDVCSLLNWLSNCFSFEDIRNLSAKELKTFFNKIQKIGY